MIRKLDRKTLHESMIDTSIALPIAWVTSYTTLALMLTMANAYCLGSQKLYCKIVSKNFSTNQVLNIMCGIFFKKNNVKILKMIIYRSRQPLLLVLVLEIKKEVKYLNLF